MPQGNILHVFLQIPAVFLLCTVVAAAMHLSEASPVDGTQYVTCFNDCEDKCKSEGNGYSFCEMKCDTDCLAKQVLGRLHEYLMQKTKTKKN
jgi:energy-converting hydrogenase Eha subunit B